MVADAEVKLFHLYVTEPLMRSGATGMETAEEMLALTREALPLASPVMDHIHYRYLQHFLEQDVVGHMESDLDGEALDLGRLRVAIAFADLAGYTRLTEEEGELGARRGARHSARRGAQRAASSLRPTGRGAPQGLHRGHRDLPGPSARGGVSAGALLEVVRAEGLLAEGRPVLVMVSGGRDSVCLLDMAVRLAGAGAVRALHVNYGLRVASGLDEEVCRSLSENR